MTTTYTHAASVAALPDLAADGQNSADLSELPLQSEKRRVSSAALLAGEKSVIIDHRGALYTLSSTKLGRLILTK